MIRRGSLASPGIALGLLAIVATTPAFAVEPDEMMGDPAQEARARDLSAGLRCLVCQNQSIDDSAAPLARDLRLIVREHIKAGDTDAEIRAYLVRRYGDFVLLKPPVEPATLLLWSTPLLAMLLGGVALITRRRPAEVSSPLTAAEQAKVDALMEG